ncbi:Histone H1 [Nesidiocoris tenuis]|uniref:Histone H1 n=1 Tax=Nesidiocoris tenuis TaxID=355587 RepID=A0ABN7AA63_9HEMI|nr:Histone H1 [Nesidiocoris tenuis]
MTETVAAAPASEPVKAKSPKKRGPKPASGAAKAKPSHPTTAQMVTTAVSTLKERGGSSLQAIKKYIGATYKVDTDKLAPFIRKYIKSAVTSGKLVQTKGSGASGSFKLPGDEGKKKKPAAAKPKAKKPAKVEKKKKKTTPVKAKAPKAAKKTKKPPTTPKAPKPKKATAVKVKASAAKPKKASPAKKAAKKPATSKKAAPKKK